MFSTRRFVGTSQRHFHFYHLPPPQKIIPPCDAPNTPQLHRATLSAVADATSKNILITITPPAVPTGAVNGDVKVKRAPVDFVLTIDVSGSMDWTANIREIQSKVIFRCST
ncbi:hypothetical protein FRB94_008551 [Tulasnella sp. JGI-2019a]|nr:hypothetical protein FRB94_008551 [Tulasnella sp. JGI-2019a]